jgi:hypothetical protein
MGATWAIRMAGKGDNHYESSAKWLLRLVVRPAAVAAEIDSLQIQKSADRAETAGGAAKMPAATETGRTQRLIGAIEALLQRAAHIPAPSKPTEAAPYHDDGKWPRLKPMCLASRSDSRSGAIWAKNHCPKSPRVEKDDV